MNIRKTLVLLLLSLFSCSKNEPQDSSSTKNKLPLVIYNSCAQAGTIFLFAKHPVGGIELWKTKHGSETFKPVKDINPGVKDSVSSLPRCYVSDKYIYFSAFGPDNKLQLWQSDGTKDGTKPADDSGSLTKQELIELKKAMRGTNLIALDQRDLDAAILDLPAGLQRKEFKIELLGKFKDYSYIAESDESGVQKLISHYKNEGGVTLASGVYLNNLPVIVQDKVYFYLTDGKQNGSFIITDGTIAGTKRENLIGANVGCQGKQEASHAEVYIRNSEILLKLTCHDGEHPEYRLLSIHPESKTSNLIYASDNKTNEFISDVLYIGENIIYFIVQKGSAKDLLSFSDRITTLYQFENAHQLIIRHAYSNGKKTYFYSEREGKMLLTDGTKEGTRLVSDVTE